MKPFLVFIGIFVAYSLGAEDSLNIPSAQKPSSQYLAIDKGTSHALDSTRNPEDKHEPSFPNPPKLNSTQIWDAGDKLQSSIWMNLAGTGCFVLAGLTGSKNPPLVVIGIGGGIAFNILSLTKLFGAGESLKKGSGLEKEEASTAKKFDPNNIDGINCIDLPNAVDRYNCSRIKRGK